MATTNVDQGPIFIGGLAHSGKTPLRLMLSTHPNIAMSRRTYMWNQFYNRYGELSQPENFERCLTAMLANKGIRALEPDPDRIRREFSEGAMTYARMFALFQQHHAERLGKLRWGDQLGSVERFADPIFAAYPAAKMIHMIRDPRDFCEITLAVSGYRQGKVGWSTARWLFSVKLAQRNLNRYPDRYKVLRYETLMAEPEETVRKICTFIKETYQPEMTSIWTIDHDEGINAASNSGDRLSAEKPRKLMSKQELVFTQTYVQTQLGGLGYLDRATNLSPSDRLHYYLVDWPVNRAGMAAWQKLKAPGLRNNNQEI